MGFNYLYIQVKKGIMTCKICNKECASIVSLGKHVRMKHKYNKGLVQYFVEYEKFKIPKCEYCNKESKHQVGLKFRKTCGDKNCISAHCKNRKMPNDVKLKISRSMIKSHSEGNHTGWSFINKDANKRSYPEKWFVKNVLNEYNLYSKYAIKEKMPFHKYFLDFSILDMKIDVEIDGQQHFRTKEAIKHDKERDDFLLENGWKVYRMAWVELKNDPNDMISNFLKWIEQNEMYRKYDVDEIIKKLNKHKLKYESKEEYNRKRIKNTNEKYKPLVEIVKNSDIDFSKFGWVKEMSNLIGMKEQKINKWMKRHMLDFYEEKCFKRKRPCSSTE